MNIHLWSLGLLAAGTPLFAALPSASREDTRPVPVIDVHAHIFNTRDLPVGGIVGALLNEVSRKPAINALRDEQIDRFESALTDALVRNANRPPLSEADFKLQLKSLKEVGRFTLGAPGGVVPVVRLTAKERKIFAEALGLSGADWEQKFSLESAREGNTKAEDVAGYDALPSDFQRLAQAAESAGWLLEPEHAAALSPTEVSAMNASAWGYLRFLFIMLQSRENIASELFDSYPNGDLFVCHMMDMARTYAGKPSVSFEKQQKQMPILARTGNRAGKLLHFTAVDPFRDSSALQTVLDGLAAGAIGVKVYPPSGYRAAQNAIPLRPARPSGAAKRWDSRYKNREADDLDSTLDGFFKVMEKKEIPLFAHCTSQGFEASSDYGWNAAPEYWALVLEKYPKLRLCFGHSGGHQFWFNAPDSGTPDEPPARLSAEDKRAWYFGRDVARLSRKFENVYCEVGYLEQILNPGGAAAFKNRLKEELSKATVPGQYDLGTKIMYGTDWHMIYKESKYRDYLDRCNEIVRDIDGGNFQARFFSGNAVTFLKLATVAADTRFSEVQRKRWLDLIDRKLPETRGASGK